MKNSKIIFILGIFLATRFFKRLDFAHATDYCDSMLCTVNGKSIGKHIGCNNDGTFASRCVKPVRIPVTFELRQVILNAHNDLRNYIANGSLPGYASATRMATQTWDDELAYLAELNTRRCITTEHDECRNTIEYKYSGQNMGDVSQDYPPLQPTDYEGIILDLIRAWFDEYQFARQSDVDRMVRRDGLPEIGHFTQLVHEKAAKVGCGLIRFDKFIEKEYWEFLQLVCNYSFGNMLDYPTYVKGRVAASCKTGTNPKFNGLCSVDEDIIPLPDDEFDQSPDFFEEKPYYNYGVNFQRNMQNGPSDDFQREWPISAARVSQPVYQPYFEPNRSPQNNYHYSPKSNIPSQPIRRAHPNKLEPELEYPSNYNTGPVGSRRQNIPVEVPWPFTKSIRM